MTWELFFYLLTVACVGVAIFYAAGFVYGLIHRPSVLFPPLLALKMAVAVAIGSPFFMVGGIALATMVMNNEFAKREDFNLVKSSIAGVVISVIGSVATLFAAVHLAWEMLE